MYTFLALGKIFPLGICRKYMKLSRHHQIKRRIVEEKKEKLQRKCIKKANV